MCIRDSRRVELDPLEGLAGGAAAHAVERGQLGVHHRVRRAEHVGHAAFGVEDDVLEEALRLLFPEGPERVVVGWVDGRVLRDGLEAVSYTHLTLPTSDLV